MLNVKGWSLTGRLIVKHFAGLGDKMAEMIARFDPETATEADREHLAGALQDTATKLAAARASFNREHEDVVRLQALLASDALTAEKLAAGLAAGKVDDATVTLFCDELEANRAKLPVETREAEDAKAYMNELQQIVDAFSQQLAEFDAVAKQARQTLATATAQKDLQRIRQARQQELDGLRTLNGHSTALDALTRRAQQVRNEAEGMKIVVDVTQKPRDRAAEIDAIRKSAMQSGTAGETPLQRIQRLSAGKTEVAHAE